MALRRPIYCNSIDSLQHPRNNYSIVVLRATAGARFDPARARLLDPKRHLRRRPDPCPRRLVRGYGYNRTVYVRVCVTTSITKLRNTDHGCSARSRAGLRSPSSNLHRAPFTPCLQARVRTCRTARARRDTRPWPRVDMGPPTFVVVRSRRWLSLWVRK